MAFPELLAPTQHRLLQTNRSTDKLVETLFSILHTHALSVRSRGTIWTYDIPFGRIERVTFLLVHSRGGN